MREEKESYTAGRISPTASCNRLKKKCTAGTRPHGCTHPMLSVSTPVNKWVHVSNKKTRQLDHREGWGKSFVSNKGRLAHKTLGGRVLMVLGLGGQVRRGLGGGKQVSVHRLFLGGRVLWLIKQRFGGGTAAILIAGVAGGSWWSHLGLTQK